MTHRHFCLGALRWKVFRNYNQEERKNLSHFIAILALQMRTKQINFHLTFHPGHLRPPEFLRTLAVLLEEATLQPDELSTLAWKQLSFVSKYLGREGGTVCPLN